MPAAPALDRGSRVDCPRDLNCDWVPAAYAWYGAPDPTSYGNYDLANRPTDLKVDTIVLHDTEESYASTIAGFTNPASYVSAHYVVRSADGFVTQFLPTKDVAWQAGNWYVNTHSVGIEQEGFAVEGATWFTEALYHSTSQLVRYLATKYGVPLDRLHIIGHDNVPGISPAGVPGMHWDPGPYWDWDHYMRLLGAPITGRDHRHHHSATAARVALRRAVQHTAPEPTSSRRASRTTSRPSRAASRPAWPVSPRVPTSCMCIRSLRARRRSSPTSACTPMGLRPRPTWPISGRDSAPGSEWS